jgi:putative aldouronate transport system substrate-binding protein
MNHIRKQKLLALASCSSVLLLAACGDSSADEPVTMEDIGTTGAMEDFNVGDTFIAEEPLEISILYRDLPGYPYDEDWMFFEVLEEKHNVTFEALQIPLSDFEERRSVTIAAGDMPDYATDTWPGNEDQFVSSGAILPISDYVHLMPHYQKRLEEWDIEEELNTIRHSDGKYYMLPGINENVHFDFSLKINQTIFDEYGLEKPNTWEELREVLTVLRDETGQTPMTAWWQGNALLSFSAPSFGTIGGWGFGDGVQFNEELNEFVYAPMQDEYKDMVEYFAGLVSDGLMDPESFTQDDDTTRSKLLNLEAFVSSGQAGTISTVNADLAETHGEGSYEFVRTPLPIGPAGPIVSGSRLVSGIMLNSNVADRDDFLALLQFIDWLYYSDEGYEFALWGVEGETFEKTDEAPGGYRPLEDISFEHMNPNASMDLQEDFGFGNAAFAFAGSAYLRESNMNADDMAFQQEMNAEREYAPIDPPYPMSAAEQEQLAVYQTNLNDMTQEYTLRFITGQYDMERWSDFMEELENQNVDAYLDLINNAYEEFQETLEEVEQQEEELTE